MNKKLLYSAITAIIFATCLPLVANAARTEAGLWIYSGGLIIPSRTAPINVTSTGTSTFGGDIRIGNLTSSTTLTVRTGPTQIVPMGSNLITNGDFATNDFTGWTAGANWSAATGKAVHTIGSVETLTQNITVVADKVYQVDFLTENASVNTFLTFSLGDDQVIFRATDEFKSITLVAPSTGSVAFTLTPSSDFDGSIDNIKVRLVTPAKPLVLFEGTSTEAMIAINPAIQGTQNTFIGVNSGLYTTEGIPQPPGNSPTGIWNTAVGYNAMANNTSGAYNTAFGHDALRRNTSGATNVAIGDRALQKNENGWNNMCLGIACMHENISGTNNVAIGANSLLANATTSDNMAIGYSALRHALAINNVAIGNYTLYDNVYGNYNVAIGYAALQHTTAGSNLAIGYLSQRATLGGTNNVSIGNATLQNNTTGLSNTAIGESALNSNIGGYLNTAVGTSALLGNTSGLFNTGIGIAAGFTGVSANKNSTGSYNTWLGANAGPGTSSQLDYTVVIGYDAVATASNQLVLGSTTISTTLLQGHIGLGTTSPYAQLSIHQGATATYVPTIFVISSSTAAYATSTVFSVNATGAAQINSATTTGVLNLGLNPRTTNASSTLSLDGKGGINMRNTAGIISCLYLVGTTPTATAGACNN